MFERSQDDVLFLGLDRYRLFPFKFYQDKLKWSIVDFRRQFPELDYDRLRACLRNFGHDSRSFPFKAAIDRGWSVSDLGEVLGWNRSKVAAELNARGLDRHSRADIRRRRLAALHASQPTLSEDRLAESLNVSKRTVQEDKRWLRANGRW